MTLIRGSKRDRPIVRGGTFRGPIVDNGGGGPTVTYAKLNPADNNGGTLSNGDLTVYYSGGWNATRATIAVDEGDWFFQCVFDTGSYAGIAVSSSNANLTYPGDNGSLAWGITSHGYNNYPGGNATNGYSFNPGDIFGCSILRSTSQAKFYKYNSGTSSWDLVYTADISAIDGDPAYPMVFGLNGGVTANFGQSAFAAAVPDDCNEGVYQ